MLLKTLQLHFFKSYIICNIINIYKNIVIVNLFSTK